MTIFSDQIILKYFPNSSLPNPQVGHWAKSPPQRLIKSGALLHCKSLTLSHFFSPYELSTFSPLPPDYYLSSGKVYYGVGGREKGILMSEGIATRLISFPLCLELH